MKKTKHKNGHNFKIHKNLCKNRFVTMIAGSFNRAIIIISIHKTDADLIAFKGVVETFKQIYPNFNHINSIKFSDF